MRRVYIENLGCSKNQVDAEVLLACLADSFEQSEFADEADLIIVNTCGFIEGAREESLETFFELYDLNPDAKFIFSGCMAQHYSEELAEELSEAAAIFGNRDLGQISKVVERVFAGERVVAVPPYLADAADDTYERDTLLNFPGSAYVKLSEGCNHRCSYCAIPLIRGNLRSRPKEQILSEVAALLAEEVVEINLIAQDLASYGTDLFSGKSCFMELLSELVVLVDNRAWIRLLYIHPDTFPAELPAFIAANPAVLPYFDIPFQHANTAVLRSMGRSGTQDSYLSLIADIRSTLPDAVFRSTILLGYPGEDDAAFNEVLDFLAAAQLDWVGSFIYSREEGTKAAKLVESEAAYREGVAEAQARKERLEILQSRITRDRLTRFVGREVDVLIEELIEGEELAIGRFWAQAPEVDGLIVVMGRDLVPGTVVRAGIRAVNGIDLEAIPLQGASDV